MQQELTVEQVRGERARLEAAIVNLARKQKAAFNLASVLSQDTATVADLRQVFAAYYSAEAQALQHDVGALEDQTKQLAALEKQLSSMVLLGGWARSQR